MRTAQSSDENHVAGEGRTYLENIDVDSAGPQDISPLIKTQDYFQRMNNSNEYPKNYVQLMLEVNMSTDFRHRRNVN